MTRVKLCGITTARNLEMAIATGADAIGLLVDVTVDSPRAIEVERAATLAAATPPFVTTVLVTMAPPERIRALVDEIAPDTVQVHGYDDPDAVRSLAATLPASLLVAVDATDPSEVRAMDGTADGLLVDSVDDEGAGGTGRAHDWERTARVVEDCASPVVLAGGLTPETVADAVRTVRPYAVDVASGIETEPGEKDPTAAHAFVAAARGAEVSLEP